MNTSDAYPFPLQHRAVQAVIASSVLMGLAVILVAVRFYTRRSIINAVQSSDWMILVSLLLSITFVGLFITDIRYGIGWHQDEISSASFIDQKKFFWMSIPFYNAAMTTAKASMIIQYMHVFPTKKMRLICSILTAILAVYGLWVVLSAFLNCIPVARFWDPSIPGHCLEYKALWYSNAALNIFTDVVILVIPIPALASLDLPLKQKAGLCCVFAVGCLVCITSICRLLSLKVLIETDDKSYHSLAVSMWSAIECNTGIICTCLTTLRPVITRLWPALSSTLFPNQPSNAGSDASFYDVSNGLGTIFRRNTTNNATCRDLEEARKANSSSSSSAGTSKEKEKAKVNGVSQIANIKIIPTPGNAFAQNLMRKGSFFDQPQQRPESYV